MVFVPGFRVGKGSYPVFSEHSRRNWGAAQNEQRRGTLVTLTTLASSKKPKKISGLS